jgi:transcriptional regulator with XRE-family HTH domain
MKTFIKREREKRGIYQKDLAVELNIAPATMATYENTDRDPPLDILCQIADRFDVSLDVLVRGKEKDRHNGRSVQEILDEYKSLSTEEINLLVAVLQTELANRAFQAHLRQDGKQNP